MECAENNGQRLGSDNWLSGYSRNDVLTPRAARLGLDAGDSGNGFGSWNRGVLIGQAGRATWLDEASRKERDTPKRATIGTGSALRDLQTPDDALTGPVPPLEKSVCG